MKNSRESKRSFGFLLINRYWAITAILRGNLNNTKTVTYSMEYYDTLAAGYDELHGEEQRRKLTILKIYLKVEKDELMLDVGCGTGISSEFFDCRIIGIDNSKEMLLEARRKSRGNAVYILAEGEHLPFKAGVFDCTICVTALHNFTSPKNAMRDMKRVTTKTGAVTVLKKAERFKELEIMVKDVMDVTMVIDEEKDRILIFNIPNNP
jgi:ubiquinone/menaquinone biosynthesis C-methylase UbiE